MSIPAEQMEGNVVKPRFGLMRTMSALISRLSLGSQLGMLFEGQRDLYQIFGYKKNLTTQDLVSRYVRQDIAGRIVELYAAGTWADPPSFKDVEDSFVISWDRLTKKQRIWTAFARADRLANLGVYSVLLLGFDDSGNMASPVTPGPNRQLLYVKPLAQDSAQIVAYENNPRSPRYGLPTLYKVSMKDNSIKYSVTSPTDATTQVSTADITVHWTRIVHVVEDPLEDEITGNPRLVRVYNLLDDLIKVTGGTAETFWMTANRGMQVDVDKEMQLDETDANELATMIEEYQHQLRRVLRTRGVKVNILGSDVPDPTGAFTMLQTMIAGAVGIPRRILFGSEAGQLASEQDRASWARRISERRAEFATPRVLIPFIIACQNAGVLPVTDMEEAIIEWGDAFHLSPLEKAQTMAQTARAMVNMSRQAQLGFPLANQAECREVLGLEGTIDPNSIELMDTAARILEADASSAEAEAESAEMMLDEPQGGGDGGNPNDPSPQGTNPEFSDRPARQRE